MTQHRSSALRRYGALLAIPTASVLALGACSSGASGGGGGESGSASQGFTFTYPVSNNIESPYEILAKSYEDSHDGVTITLNAVPNDSYGSTLRTQLQAGNAADLFYTTPGSGQDSSAIPLADAGFLEPLTDPASQALVTEESKGLFYLDDDLVAQPVDITPAATVFNSGTGVDFPETTEDLIAECAPLAEEGKSFLAVAGSAPPNTGIMALVISATRVYADNPTWDQDRIAGTETFAGSAGWQDTLQTIVDLKDAGCFQPGVEGGGFDAITNGITQATSLAAFAPAGAAGDLMRATPSLTLVVEPFPPADGGKPFVFASANNTLSVNSKGDGKEAAKEFLAWLAEPENSAAFAETSANVPVTGFADAELLPQYEPLQELLSAGDYAPLPNLSWPNPSVYDALGTGVQGLLTGQTEPQAVLEAMDAAWDQ